jgi:ankyrin repeat protein
MIKPEDRSGDTPLHCAVKKNRPALVALLLAQDKSLVNISNRQGQKPTDFPSGIIADCNSDNKLGGDVRKLLSGEIEDPAYYSSAIFASLDNEDWNDIQMQLSDESGDSGSSGSGEDSSDEDMG